jgi:PAS domain S-box-containing protein
MIAFFLQLFDTRGFVARQDCGSWSTGHIWLHVGSDLFIWLAYMSIPVVLLWYIRRWNSSPARWLGYLFAAFILACGFTHLADGLMFYYPAYRFAGLLKLVTAIVSWATVFVLIPMAPRLLESLRETTGSPLSFVEMAAPDRPLWVRLLIAALATVAALLSRTLLDPLLVEVPMYVVPMLAILFTGWVGGFLPAILALLLTFLGTLYWFVEPRYQLVAEGVSAQFGMVLFFFSGVIGAFLASSEYAARRQLADALGVATERQNDAEREAERRRRAEEEAQEAAFKLAISQRQTERALDDFRTLTETMPQLVWVVDPQGGALYYNNRWSEYTGLTQEELHKDGWLKLVHPDFRNEFEQRWKRTLERGEPFEMEYLLGNTNGEYRWYLARANPARTTEGVIDRWLGTCTDIHDNRRLQEDIRTSFERFHTLTEALPQLVWTADSRGNVRYFNSRWLERTGLTPNNLDTPEGRELLHPDDVDRVHQKWMKAVELESSQFTEEFRLRHADGQYYWYLSVSQPVRDTEQRVLEWVGALTNIHDQKTRAQWLEQQVEERTAALREEIEERTRAQNVVQAMATELKRSNQELEAFASVASHDLQEPLRKILAFGERLVRQQRDKFTDTGRDQLDRIMNAANRMRRLIEDLLSYSRVTTRVRPFTPTNLSEVVEGVLSDLEIRVVQSKAKIHVDDLPTIDADPVQMRQLFQNLISNALKFNPPDKPPVVSITARSVSQEHVQLAISDQGIGFEPRFLDRIFLIFQRLHGVQEYEGTGIGLAICKKIVDRHHGTITAESELGKGATFIVTLPVKQFTMEDSQHE